MEALTQYSKEISMALIAALGGVAKHLHAYLTGVQRFNFWRMTARAIVSCFSGYVAAEVVSNVLGMPNMAMAAAGLWGYLGAEGIDYLVALVKTKMK